MEQENQQVPAPVKKQGPDAEKTAAQLRTILQDIEEARSKNNRKAENSFYKKASAVFVALTGENILKKAVELAKAEVVSEGFKISNESVVLSKDNFAKQVEIFRAQQQSYALQKAWESISEPEKKSYQNDMSVFILEIEKKRELLNKTLAVEISKEIFYDMIAGGYMFPDIKKSIWDGKIKIPISLGGGAYKFSSVSKKEFENLITALQILFNLVASQAIEEKLTIKFMSGKKRWHQREKRKIREIIENKINEIEEKKRVDEITEMKIQSEIRLRLELREKEFAQEVAGLREADALKKLEEFESSGKKAGIEMKKDLEKIQKNLGKEIKTIGEEEKKIKKIKEKQAKKNLVLHKKEAYMKFVELEEGEDNKNNATLPKIK